MNENFESMMGQNVLERLEEVMFDIFYCLKIRMNNQIKLMLRYLMLKSLEKRIFIGIKFVVKSEYFFLIN